MTTRGGSRSDLFRTIQELQARVYALHTALQPFAAMDRDGCKDADDTEVLRRGVASDMTIITEGDFRRAAHVLAEVNERIYLVRDLVAALGEAEPILAEYTEEAGPCDHAVGICVCGIKSVLEEVRAVLARAGIES